jgi:hypothetical protein
MSERQAMARVTEAIEVGPHGRVAPPAARTEERRYPRGAIVVVDDGCRYEARIVAVIGVVAVVARRPQDAAADACHAVPVRCCRPAGDEPPKGGGRAAR